MISKDAQRSWLIRPRRREVDEGPWAARGAAIPTQGTPARIELAALDPIAAAAVEPVAAAAVESVDAETEMEASWRAYGEVVDVLGAITHAARLAERGVCAEMQLNSIDLLAADLDAAWGRWEAAHQRVIGVPAAVESTT